MKATEIRVASLSEEATRAAMRSMGGEYAEMKGLYQAFKLGVSFVIEGPSDTEPAAARASLLTALSRHHF